MAPLGDASTPASPSRLWLLAGAGALAIGGLLMYAASAATAPEATAPAVSEPAVLVETARAEPAPARYTIAAPGRLTPRQTLSVVGEVAGKVVEINPELVVGGRIDEGALLFRIGSGDYLAELKRAEAGLANARARRDEARAERDRQVALSAKNIASASARDRAVAADADAEAAVKQAEAAVTLAQRALAKTTVRAPFPALVASETLSLGTYVAPGEPLATLLDATAGEIRAGLSPQDVAAVRDAQAAAGGTRLPVRAEPNEGSIGSMGLAGYLDTFAPRIDPTSRTVSVVAVFPDAFAPEHDGAVFADDYMTLEIPARVSGAGQAYAVPEAAIRQGRHVWLVDDARTLRKIAVQTVARTPGGMIVTADRPLDGARLLMTPLADEHEGLPVRTSDSAEG